MHDEVALDRLEVGLALAGEHPPEALSGEALATVNNAPRVWQLDVAPAGERQIIPSGFQQAVPGILVMFTILILLTSSGTLAVAVIAGEAARDRVIGILQGFRAGITRIRLIGDDRKEWMDRLSAN